MIYGYDILCYPSGTIFLRTKAICSKRMRRFININVNDMNHMLGKPYILYTIIHEC